MRQSHLFLALSLLATPALAQQAGSTVGSTAHLDTPRTMHDVQMPRPNQQDSEMAGGPGITFPGTSIPLGSSSGGGGGPPSPMPGVTDGINNNFGFSAADLNLDSARPHNAGVQLWLSVSPDGTWAIQHQLAGQAIVTDASGAWASAPSASVGSGYTVSIAWVPLSVESMVGPTSCPSGAPFQTPVAPVTSTVSRQNYICNGGVGSLSSDFVGSAASLSVQQKVRAFTGNIIGGNTSNGGSTAISGEWRVTIRNTATGGSVTNSVSFALTADADP